MLKKLNSKEIKELRLETLVKMTDLATAGFGLVAALAWNDAISALFSKFLPKTTGGGIIAQILYAVLVPALVVFITVRLSRLTGSARTELEEIKDLDRKK
jgi:hypothetical protein